MTCELADVNDVLDIDLKLNAVIGLRGHYVIACVINNPAKDDRPHFVQSRTRIYALATNALLPKLMTAEEIMKKI